MQLKTNNTLAVALAFACVLGLGSIAGAEHPSKHKGQASHKRNAFAPTGAAQTGEATLPQGVTAKDPKGTEGIRDVLAVVTETALTKDKFGDFVDQFAGPDRKRLQENTKITPELEQAIEKFKQQWKVKYNQDFDIKNKAAVYGDQFLSIAQGEISDPTALAVNWPLNPTKTAKMQKAEETGSKELDKGRDVAVVVLHPSPSQLPLRLSFIHEAPDFWKIDIPDGIAADTIKTNLVQEINHLGAAGNKLPANVEDAYRYVTGRILLAAYNAEPSLSDTGNSAR